MCLVLSGYSVLWGFLSCSGVQWDVVSCILCYKYWYKLEVSQLAKIIHLEIWQSLALNSNLFDSNGHILVKLLHWHFGYEFKEWPWIFSLKLLSWWTDSVSSVWTHHWEKLGRQHLRWGKLNYKDRLKSNSQGLYFSLLNTFICWR